jgi:methionine-gamma-lyase
MSAQDTRHLGPNTRLVHDDFDAEHVWYSHVMPIFMSNTFIYEDNEHLQAVWQHRELGYVYTRDDNPTVDVFQKKIAQLEGGDWTQAAASGMGAISAALLATVKAGDHIVSSDQLYYESAELIDIHLGQLGVNHTFVHIADLDAVRAAMRPETKVIYTETVSNPLLIVADIAALAQIAHEHGAILIVDNTFASPALVRPLELGADLCAESATKYICGHGTAVGGVVTGKGDAHKQALFYVIHRFGGCLSPFNAWLLLSGIKTLNLRVHRQCDNALKLARFLEGHPVVEKIYYPGLESHPQHGLATRMMGGRYGSMITVEPVGGKDTRGQIFDNLKLTYLATSLGDVSTLAIQRRERAITRISVGIEEPEDLIADWKQALDRVRV